MLSTTETILNKEAVNADGEYEDIVRFAITDEEWSKQRG